MPLLTELFDVLVTTTYTHTHSLPHTLTHILTHTHTHSHTHTHDLLAHTHEYHQTTEFLRSSASRRGRGGEGKRRVGEREKRE